MEQDFLDAEEPTSSKAKVSEKPKSFDENTPILPVNKADGRYVPGEGLRFTSPITLEERNKIGSYYQSQNPNKLLSQQQSWYEQLGHFGGRVVTNFVGDTIESFGSVHAVGEGIVDEVKGKDADFQNSVMEFGEAIKEWGKKNMPQYQENPNESWNLSDPAWWFEGIESAFSSLSFLVGGMAATKGVGALAKLTRAEQLLAKAGANVEKLKLGTKIASSAAFMRNAENMMESYQLRQNVKQSLLQEWNDSPKKFEELVNSEVGQELAAENREVNQENLSNFIAGKAGWKAYAINSMNIMFDALQVAPIFKGFNPATRISKAATSSKVKAANRKAYNPNAASASKLDRALDYINPTISGLGRSLTEGVEEAVNYIGTEEGKHLADVLSKEKKDSSFGKRMSEYLKSGDMYESAFWGTIGGGLFEGGGAAIKKLSSKGVRANDTTDFRIAEIAERANVIQKASEDIKATTEDPHLTDEEKKKKIGITKSSLALDLGLRASQAGNVDLLIEQIKSPEYKQKMIDLGIADPLEVDKAIVKTVQDIETAETLYKQYANSFYYAKGSEQAKASLVRENVVTDFFIRKREEKKNELAKEIENLKANDPYIKNSNLINLENLIHLQSLKAARRTFVEFLGQNEHQVLTERGKKELERMDAEIAQLTESTKEEKLDLEKINKDILAKNAELILLEGVNNVEGEKLVDNRSSEAIKKRDEEIEEARKNLRNELLENFKQQVETVAAGENVLENLEKLKTEAKDDKDALKIINDAIRKQKDKEAKVQAKKEADEATSNETPTETDAPFNPVKEEQKEQDEFGDIPQFEIVELDDNQVNPNWKVNIDKFIADRNIDELKGLIGDQLAAMKPLEVQYTKNQIQRARDAKNQKEDLAKLNTSLPTNNEIGFEMDEEAQIRKDTSTKKDKITIQDLQNPDRRSIDDILDKDSIISYNADPHGDPVTVYVPVFSPDPNQRSYQFDNGNILVKDEHVDTVKTLLSPKFTVGSVIEITHNKEYPLAQAKWKGDINNEPFKVTHNGVFIGALGTVDGVRYEIEKAERAGRTDFADKLKFDLEQIIKIRSQLSLDNKVYTSKVMKKGNGTIISRGTRSTDLRSVEGIFTDFYALDPRNPIDKNTLVNIAKRDEVYGHTYSLRPGIIYGLINDANGRKIPSPLTISKVTKSQAEQLRDSIKELLGLLNQGMHYSNPEVIAIKEKIEKYIKVDRSQNYDKAVGFRIYPKSTKEGKTTEARIEMRYWSSKRNEMQTAVIKISEQHGGSWVGLFDSNGEPINPFENSKKKLDLDHPFFLDLLQRKYQNVDFFLLGDNKPFTHNGKTYPTYKEYLIKEEVIQTDVAQVVDKKGNKISDLFGFKNDFKLYIEATVTPKPETKSESEFVESINKEMQDRAISQEEVLSKAVDELVTPEEANQLKEELLVSTDEEVKEKVKEAVKTDIAKRGTKVVGGKGLLRKIVNRIKKAILSIVLLGSIFTGYNFINSDFTYEDVEQYTSRGLVKMGIIDPQDAELTIEQDTTTEKVNPVDSAYEKSITQFKRLKDVNVTGTNIWSYRNQWLNKNGFEYVAGVNNKNFRANKDTKYSNVEGVAHHLIMLEESNDLTDLTSTETLKQTSAKVLNSTAEGDFIPVIERLGNGKVKITYTTVGEAKKGLKDNQVTPVRLRQTKVSDLDFNKSSSAEGFKSNIHSVTQKSTGQGFNSLVYTNKKAYGKFSGGSVVLLFNDSKGNLIVREYSGSIEGIQNEVELIKKQFEVTDNDITLGVFDAGSYTGKVGSKSDKTISPAEYHGYNPTEMAGSSLMIPSITTNQAYFKELDLAEMMFDMGRLKEIDSDILGLEERGRYFEEQYKEKGPEYYHEDMDNVDLELSNRRSEKQRIIEKWKFVSNQDVVDSTETAYDINQEHRKNYAFYNNSTVDVNTMLEDILKNPLNDNIRELATFFKSNVHKINLPIVKGTLSDTGQIASVDHGLDYPSGRMVIDSQLPISEVYLQQVFLHELAHAVTNTAIFNSLDNPFAQFTLLQTKGKIDMGDIKFRDNASQEVKDFLLFVVQERNHLIDVLTKKYGKSLARLKMSYNLYGLSDPMEFIAEVMANPLFREEIRAVDNDFLTKFYNALVELINAIFKTNLNHKESANLKRITKTISNFIDGQQNIAPINVDMVTMEVTNTGQASFDFRKNFTNAEVDEVTNTLEGIILESHRTNKLVIDNEATEIDDRRKVRNATREAYDKYVAERCPESCKAKATKVQNFFNEFYDNAINNLNRHFKRTMQDEIDDLGDDTEVNKEWDNKKHFSKSSQESVPNQVKMLIRSTPDLNSTNAKFVKGEPVWDAKKSSMTGLTTYVDFNKIYPYLVRNLVGARTQNEIIDRINTMAEVYPSFAYISHYLQHDANLLAQFEISLAKKYIYDSYVTFIKNIEGQREIWTNNEMKSTRYDYIIADEWITTVNNKIDEIQDATKKAELQSQVNAILLEIGPKKDNFKDHIDELSKLVQRFSEAIGVELSLGTIKGRLQTTSEWRNFEIMTILGNIYDSILRGKKNNDFGRLNTLAKLESLIRFDVVENSGLDISGNLIYAIRNPNFISNWFSDARSNTEEGKQAFKEKLFRMAQVPKMQFSNWLWNDAGGRKGILNYELVNNKRVPTSVNWDYMKVFNFHNLGGAKELVSKTAQDYSEFSEEDWMLYNLINYIRPDDRAVGKPKEFALYPSLIPSDSSSMYSIEAHRIRLSSGDFKKVGGNLVINPESKLFKAVLDTNFQEVKEIQQATERLFTVVEDQLVPRTDLNINNLQQYYDYTEVFHNEDGSIDWNKTLLEDGKPTGKSMYFQNMIVFNNGTAITLNDIGIKRNGHIGVGPIGAVNRDKIIEFTKSFVAQQVQAGISEYRSLEEKVAGKYGHISNGTFEGVIAEYILNTYVANVEQFTFFNGDIGEYKNRIDTNKRAKQMFAPGIALSPEAMKIQYENGNFSDGVTFRGITMKDVKTKSATFDFIVDKVKEGLIAESPNKYFKSEIKNFSLQGKEESFSRLEKDVYRIVADYLKINAGDAQGYITLDRYEQILRGLGKITPEVLSVIDQARRGVLPNMEALKAFPPIKGFYYGREYDVVNNRLYSAQVKYSSMPLIPQLVKGTELEKLMDYMNRNNVEEAFFESAHKVGARNISNVFGKDGSINELVLDKIEPTIYYNKNWQLQLEVPEHIIDDENRLGTQIAKLIIANLDPKATYTVNGKDYKHDELIEHYFNVLNNNIEESANQLVELLGVQKDGERGWIVRDEDIQKLLIDEIERRGLSQNYRYAVEIGEDGQFRLPLFANNMALKWEAILTSLFTNRIVRQKLAGGSLALGSRLGIDKQVSQRVYDKEYRKKVAEELAKLPAQELLTILNNMNFFSSVGNVQDWRADMGLSTKEFEATLKQIEKGKSTKTTEKLLAYIEGIKNTGEVNMIGLTGGMTERRAMPLFEFFDNEAVRKYVPTSVTELIDQRVDANAIQWSKEKADDRTLRSYREGEGGRLLVVEVLLSAWSSQLFNGKDRLHIDELPDEIKTMVGYRIPTTDKAYMTVFKVVGFLPEASRGMIVTPDDMVVQMGQDFDIDKWFVNRKHFYIDKEGTFVIPNIESEKEEFKNLQKQIKELRKELDAEFESDFGITATEDVFVIDNIETDFKRAKLKMLEKRLSSLMIRDEEYKMQWRKGGSKYARQNEIVSIWQSILTHPSHVKEVLTPSGYPTISETAKIIDRIFKVDDKNLPVTTEAGQRAFRKRNLTGKSLVAIAANLNAFGAIAQVTKMKLNPKLGFTIKHDLSKYNEQELKDRYKEDYLGDGKVLFRNLGFAPDGSYLNINGDLILTRASEGVVAFVDNAKDPKADKLNLTPYTYTTYHAAVLAGVDPVTMGLFMRQPIIKMLNDFYFNQKSLLGDGTGDQIETIKKFYQTVLYSRLVESGKVKVADKLKKVLDRRKADKADQSFDKRYLIFLKREDTESLLGYNPDNIEPFTQEELHLQLERRAGGFSKLDADSQVDYLRKQLQYIELFNKWKESGKAVEDILRATKTDTKGAGPSMEITNSLVRSIMALKDSVAVTIDNDPAITRIYPKMFGSGRKSVYSPLESYLEHANLLSVDILQNIFINQSISFKNVTYTVNGLSKPETPERRDLLYRNANRFLSVAVLQDFPKFKERTKQDILGIGKEFNFNTKINFNTFKNLSVANKVHIMKRKMKEAIAEDNQHIMRALEPNIDAKKLKEDGYHKLSIVFYNNEYSDDNIIRSLIDMYQSGDKFQVDLAESLIAYSFVADGLTYGLESFSKVIPNQILHEMGLGHYLRDIHKLARASAMFDMKTVDKFYRNNHNNNSIVPIVKTRWDFVPSGTADFVKEMLREGKQRYEIANKTGLSDYNIFDIEQNKENVIKKDSEGHRQTKDGSPIWDNRQEILAIGEKSLKTLSNTIVNAPYVISYNKEGKSFLYKKYIVENQNERGDITWETSFDGNVYYYKVGKLGKDGIFEYTDSSIFAENNLEQTDKVLRAKVENIINKVHEQKIITQKKSTMYNITFTESYGGYKERTIENASADVTIAIAANFETAGEKLTKNAVVGQGKKYIAIDYANLINVSTTNKAANEIANQLTKSQSDLFGKEISLNIAGNGLYTLQNVGATQEEVDRKIHSLLLALKANLEGTGIKIKSIRSGGQTGVDEAGAKAGIKLGVPTSITAPKGWLFRNAQGSDIANEQLFKGRFNIGTNEFNLNNTSKDKQEEIRKDCKYGD